MNEKLTKIADCLEELAGLLREAISPMQEAPEKDTAIIGEKEETEKKEEKTISLEDVRTVLADLSRKGHTKEMKALLSQFGASKLSDVAPANYATLLEAAKEAANA
ncbi:MAG: hypothetical protein IJ899_13075 [Blautia sp.]|nr:hypothetical protein [Blautia sp.]